MLSLIFQGIVGGCFGVLAASGVLTVLTAVGLVPRYVGRVHEAKHILLFENMIILGTMGGTFVTLFSPLASGSDMKLLSMMSQIGEKLKIFEAVNLIGSGLESLYGFFSGIFVGTLALAIAEMLDSFPIYFRRARLGGGLRIILLAVALGKMTGAFLYFYLTLYRTVPG